MGYSSLDEEEEEEEEIFYGTPLPPLDPETNAPKKADLDLTVRDEKGRRRFHGAFTGGFSAGYFNTVGSVEGWVPAQFISNKGEKWDKNLLKSKPEDYMDEEDFGVFGIAPKRVQAKEEYQPSELSGFAGFRDPNASVIDVIRDVIKPKRESVGVRLFKQMQKGKSYKRAQVVSGEREVKKYGCDLPPSYTDPIDDEEENIIEYVVPFEPKNDMHGIGYQGIRASSEENPQNSRELKAVLSGGKRLQIKGEAFGYGALEGEDDFDEDAQVYTVDDLSTYDFAIGPAPPKPTPSVPPTSKSSSKKLQELEGFVKSTTLPPKRPSVNDLPTIPRGWKPKLPFNVPKMKKSRWDKGIGKSQETPVPVVPEKPLTMNANVRAVLLGEEVVRVVGTKVEKKVDDTSKNVNEDAEAKDTRSSSTPALKSKLSGFFACKFVESSTGAEKNELRPGLNQQSMSRKKEHAEEADAKESQSLLGKSSRETYQWHPHTLLCRRFNVPHPYPEYPDVVGLLRIGQPEESKKISSSGKKEVNIFAHLFETPIDVETDAKSEKQLDAASKSKAFVVSAVPGQAQESEVDVDGEEEEKEERPPLDLFKAIFASSEEEESEEEDSQKDEKNDEAQKVGILENDSNENKVNRVAAPAEGVFANIDFDSLKNFNSSVNAKSNEEVHPQVSSSAQTKKSASEDSDADFYGPALPPTVVNEVESCSSGAESEKRKRSVKREKQKKKHKKEKKKHKKRRHSSP